MRKVIIAFLAAWVTLFATLIYLGEPAEANADWLELQEVNITYRSYLPGAVYPLITENSNLPGHDLDKELNLTVNSNVLEYFYWNNTVHSMTDRAPDGGSQFRMVGWEFGLGLDLSRIYGQWPVSVGYYHWSTHLLDTEWGLGHWPVQDAIEVKINLFQKARR